MTFKTIDDVDVRGKRVLMRVDFNVPMSPRGRIEDDFRIRHALPSIRSVLSRGGRLVLLSHLGRPSGNGLEPSLSLAPLASHLGELLGSDAPRGVGFPSTDCLDDPAVRAVSKCVEFRGPGVRGERHRTRTLGFKPARTSRRHKR